MPIDAAPSDDLLFTPAHRLAAMIAAGALSARELVAAVVARACAVAPALNCFAVPLFEEALEAAREADARQARGDPLGPLHGVPVTVKDGVATAGHPLTVGSRAEAATVATTDDPVWTRLRDAGAILLGKTTTPEYLHKIVTDSPIYGVTRNPWSLAHSPGGSSGGAAAALAAGVGPLAVGSDGGGSLRCPASCTNTLALKPTMGRVPHAGIPDAFGYYSTMGPMTRDLRDLALMLSVMAGPHEADAASLRVPPFAFDDDMMRPAGRLRVGWLADPGGYRTASEVTGLAAAALQSLADRHIDLVAVDPGLLAYFRMNKASRWQQLVRLRIPSALPFFFAGLRIASGLSLIGAVVAEFVAGTGGRSAGLAYEILQASFQLDVPRMFAALLLITLTGIALALAMAGLTRVALRWHGSAAGDER